MARNKPDGTRTPRLKRGTARGGKQVGAWHDPSPHGGAGVSYPAITVLCLKKNSFVPVSYLRDVLGRVSTHRARHSAELTPSGWHETR